MEKELKEIDFNLADPEKFKELSKNANFFKDYDRKQLILKEKEQIWEAENIKLDRLKQEF